MKLWFIVLGAITTACCAAGVPAATSATARAGVTVPVVRCSAFFGGASGRNSVPRTLTLRDVPPSTAGLVAYTNTSGFLLGPPHLRCAPALGADGNAMIQLWPK